jgi:hypothetical protein
MKFFAEKGTISDRKLNTKTGLGSIQQKNPYYGKFKREMVLF